MHDYKNEHIYYEMNKQKEREQQRTTTERKDRVKKLNKKVKKGKLVKLEITGTESVKIRFANKDQIDKIMDILDECLNV